MKPPIVVIGVFNSCETLATKLRREDSSDARSRAMELNLHAHAEIACRIALRRFGHLPQRLRHFVRHEIDRDERDGQRDERRYGEHFEDRKDVRAQARVNRLQPDHEGDRFVVHFDALRVHKTAFAERAVERRDAAVRLCAGRIEDLLRDLHPAVQDAFAGIQPHIAAQHILAVRDGALRVADEKVGAVRVGYGDEVFADHQRRVCRRFFGIIRLDRLQYGSGDVVGVFPKQRRLFLFKIVAGEYDQRTAQYRKGNEDHQQYDGEIFFEQSGGRFPVRFLFHTGQSFVSNL